MNALVRFIAAQIAGIILVFSFAKSVSFET